MLRHNRNFALVLTASGMSALGDGVTALAMPWLASLLTREPGLISLVATAAWLPWLLFALPAGVVTDRVDLRRLMVRMDVLRGFVLLGVLAIALWAGGTGAVAGLAGLAFVAGTADVLHGNASQTVLPRLVPKESLERANGMMWSLQDVTARLIGPPLAGVLIAAGMALPFALDAASFAIAAACVALVRLPATPPRGHAPFGAALKEGFAFLWQHQALRRLGILLGVVNALSAAFFVALVLYGQERLGLDSRGYGLLLGAGAAGGIAAGLFGPRVARWFGPSQTIAVTLVAMALAYGLMAVTRSALLAGIGLFTEAFAGTLWNIVTVSWRQRIIPTGLMGRVNSAYRFFGSGGLAVGGFAGGIAMTLAEAPLGREAAIVLPVQVAAAASVVLAGYAALRIRLS